MLRTLFHSWKTWALLGIIILATGLGICLAVGGHMTAIAFIGLIIGAVCLLAPMTMNNDDFAKPVSAKKLNNLALTVSLYVMTVFLVLATVPYYLSVYALAVSVLATTILAVHQLRYETDSDWLKKFTKVYAVGAIVYCLLILVCNGIFHTKYIAFKVFGCENFAVKFDATMSQADGESYTSNLEFEQARQTLKNKNLKKLQSKMINNQLTYQDSLDLFKNYGKDDFQPARVEAVSNVNNQNYSNTPPQPTPPTVWPGKRVFTLHVGDNPVMVANNIMLDKPKLVEFEASDNFYSVDGYSVPGSGNPYPMPAGNSARRYYKAVDASRPGELYIAAKDKDVVVTIKNIVDTP